MKNILVILLLAITDFCVGQTNSNTNRISHSSSVGPEVDGIVYFSADNGVRWQNKSAGLPAKISIGLGGIAVSGTRLALMSKDSGLYFFDSSEDHWIKTATDEQIIQNNPGALTFFKDRIFVGTQFGGVFSSAGEGKGWTTLNTGLKNLAIRKLVVIDNKLYAATNGGLYSYDELLSKWEPEYGSSTLQVNGITAFDGNIYIATNQGAFTTPKGRSNWKKIFKNGALHNISADDKTIYAMVYNELFSSADKGASWKSIQQGLPRQLYTFNVMKSGNSVFAAEWDGVYRKDNATENWKLSGSGLPGKFAITNMQVYNGIIVVSGSERKLRGGMTGSK